MGKEGDGMKEDIARWVKYYRELKGWSQSQLARECSKSPSVIFRLERNDDGVNFSTIVSVAKALGVPIEALLYGPLEFRMTDDTHRKKYNEGYRKAIEDICRMTEERIPTVMMTIHGKKGQRAFKNILRKLRDDSESRDLFRSLNGKAVIRVTGTGDVDEIC